MAGTHPRNLAKHAHNTKHGRLEGARRQAVGLPRRLLQLAPLYICTRLPVDPGLERPSRQQRDFNQIASLQSIV